MEAVWEVQDVKSRPGYERAALTTHSNDKSAKKRRGMRSLLPTLLDGCHSLVTTEALGLESAAAWEGPVDAGVIAEGNMDAEPVG
jgi:hypothetical protein